MHVCDLSWKNTVPGPVEVRLKAAPPAEPKSGWLGLSRTMIMMVMRIGLQNSHLNQTTSERRFTKSARTESAYAFWQQRSRRDRFNQMLTTTTTHGER